MKRLIPLLLLFAPAIASANFWCLYMDQVEAACSFNTANDCMRTAERQGGYCRPAQNGAGVTGEAPWCVITSDSRKCTYFSRNACNQAARTLKGGCVENTEKLLSEANDNQKKARRYMKD